MTTARELITDAYIDLDKHNPSQTLAAKLAAYGLRVFNRMIAAWANENLMIPYTVTENFNFVSGTTVYTMGLAGTASTTRARKLIQCWTRINDSMDFPIKVITQQEYNNIRDKTLGGRPGFVYYDPTYPIGNLYFYFRPNITDACFIETIKLLTNELDLADDVTLDTSYEEAIVLNLRLRLAGRNFTLPAGWRREARDAKNVIKRLNSANRQGVMKMPPGIAGAGAYDFQSDTYSTIL